MIMCRLQAHSDIRNQPSDIMVLHLVQAFPQRIDTLSHYPDATSRPLSAIPARIAPYLRNAMRCIRWLALNTLGAGQATPVTGNPSAVSGLIQRRNYQSPTIRKY